MMTAGSVHVAVREFFLGGSPHGGHFDLEVEVLARERMVTIERYHVARKLRDRDGTRTVRGLSLQVHPHPHVADTLERAARHALHELRVVLAVTFGRSDRDLQPIADGATRQLTLESRDQLPVTVQIGEGLVGDGAIDHLSRIVPEDVVDADDLVLTDAHVGSDLRGTRCGRTGRVHARARRARRIPLRLGGSPPATGQLEGIRMRIICLGVLTAAFATTALAGEDAPAAVRPRTPAMADNPFAAPSTLPFQLPPFDRIHDGDYRPAFDAGMAEQLREVEAIAHNAAPPTFANTIVALERSGRVLERVETTFSNLNACNTDP